MAFMVLFFPIFQQTGKKVSSSFLIALLRDWADDTFMQCSCAAQGFPPTTKKVKPHECSLKGFKGDNPMPH